MNDDTEFDEKMAQGWRDFRRDTEAAYARPEIPTCGGSGNPYEQPDPWYVGAAWLLLAIGGAVFLALIAYAWMQI